MLFCCSLFGAGAFDSLLLGLCLWAFQQQPLWASFHSCVNSSLALKSCKTKHSLVTDSKSFWGGPLKLWLPPSKCEEIYSQLSNESSQRHDYAINLLSSYFGCAFDFQLAFRFQAQAAGHCCLRISCGASGYYLHWQLFL